MFPLLKVPQDKKSFITVYKEFYSYQIIHVNNVKIQEDWKEYDNP